MTITKQLSNSRHSRLALQARAGIIFESDNLADEHLIRTNRTARIIRIVKTSLGTPARVSDDRAITDILTDLRHYCDSKGLDFQELRATADAICLEAKACEPE